jgi:hypothetical protein
MYRTIRAVNATSSAPRSFVELDDDVYLKHGINVISEGLGLPEPLVSEIKRDLLETA